MAEFLTFAAQELLTKVASLAAEEFNLVWGFEGELTKLRESLVILEAVLRDAEHPRQDQGKAMKLWLNKLEDIAHHTDDVLDGYAYELLRRNQMKTKVQHSFSPSNSILFRVKITHKIKKINTSLESSNKMASTIGLVAKAPSLEATSSHDIRIDRETYSDFKKDENFIIGRKEVVSDIVKALTNSNNNRENDLSVLAIVGMGGLGKTTLAKFVYHDDKIKQHFQAKIWVCVSTPFEVNSILRGILESLKPENAAVQAIDAISRILKKELKEKRYLLVLDDVWNEDAKKWDDLISCLPRVTDACGSSILVTTRSDKVAKIVETLPRCDLRKLSDDECWLILKDKAIPVGSSPIAENQEKLGREIAKKCGGVPLMANVLGGMMRSKNSDGWQSIVENDIWDLPEGESRILSILKLSFDDLRSPSLKQCFAYCSNFSKDFEFDKDDLIQLWMAQGWLHPSPDNNNVEMEEKGNEYFHILLEKSFFQDARTDGRGNISYCKMHDLVHDLSENVSKSKNSRSLFSNGEALGSTLPRFKALRVLNLYKADIQELPISVGKLKHLRYLNVMKTRVKAFPKSLGLLYHLQTLKMPYHLDEFPKEIANLINLRHVYYGKHVKVPIGILGRLTNLRSLPFLKVGEEIGPGIEELGGLNQLKGTLSIYGLENVRDGEVQKAKLVEKKHIRKLVLGWKLSRPSNNVDNEEDVLEGLRPHSNLEFMEIQGFMGGKFPSWLLLSNNLKEIELFECNKCEGVPILGHLPNLVHVKMTRMENLKCLGFEFYGYNHASHAETALFPALKTLHIRWSRNLIEWMEAPTDRLRVFPCLEELILSDCDKLTSAPSHFPSLQKLRIECMDSWMPIASIISSQLTTLIDLEIWGINGLTSLPEGMLKANKNLARLGLFGCWELTSITPQGLGFESLQSLRIWGCPKLRYLPDGLLHSLSLEDLKIENCESLESIPIPEHGGLPSLRTLVIDKCPQLSSLPEGLQYCTSLQKLQISKSSKITCIPITSMGLPSLRELCVMDCPELSSLPSGLGYCTSLQDLSIESCHKVTSISIDSLISLQSLSTDNVECLPTIHVGFTSLRQLTISGCTSTNTQFELQFCVSLQILVSLQDLKIRNCPNLETIPSLDKLTSLRWLEISGCSRLKCLPSGVASSSRLKTLCIGPFWSELDSFPAIQVIPQLKTLRIQVWPKLKSLPEQIQHFTSLTSLSVNSFYGLEAIPEWLGNLASLEFLYIQHCKNVMYLPSVEAMHRLTKLNSLSLIGCPLLSERCAEESGPEWPKICHIPDFARESESCKLSNCTPIARA